MFGEGARRLIDALPDLGGLDRREVRRLLSGAWLDAVRQRDFALPGADAVVAADLRRLATALEVRLFVGTDLDVEARRACAFVAAEALGVVRELAPSDSRPEPIAFGSTRRMETVEEALLYLSAGFDANAALTAAEIAPDGSIVEAAVAEWTLARIRALLDATRTAPAGVAPDPEPDSDLRARVRHALWQRIGTLVEAHLRWLRMLSDEDPGAAAALRGLAAALQPFGASAAHADLHHLALLLAEACDDTYARALRTVPAPSGDDDRFAAYQRSRAARRPLLWPATAAYAQRALPGPAHHAVVTVPTGAGKSSVAELAAAQALHSGWVLYLAPTNALVAQIRRDLGRAFNDLGVAVVGLTGGAEYSIIDADTLQIADRQIAVMTPEKCSLALRQSPDLFEGLSLCVMDEAHLIGDAQSRGVIAELVLAEVLHRAPNVRILLLSALIDGPDSLAEWLEATTGTPAIGVKEPWRPTRTLRALCGIVADQAEDAERAGVQALANMPARRTGIKMPVQLRLLGALHGTWTGEDRGDYAIVDTGVSIEARVERRTGRIEATNHTTPATRALAEHLAGTGHRLLVFLPADRHAPFAAAGELTGPGPGPPAPEVESFLILADAEIAGAEGGRVTAVRGALDKGIALHTSAMTVEEQRASEIAFERGTATMMLATGTLAQGLNLPATAVIIGGTHVGDAREATTPLGRARAKAQLLNAIGRAGRAQTAARSLAIVVPANPVRVAAIPDVASARRAAPWLAAEDGSIVVRSQLGNLISNALSGTADVTAMDVPEQTAFAFLSFTAESGDATQVLARTLAAHRSDAVEHAELVTQTLRDLGREYLTANQSPAWIATAAHRAGIALPAAAALERALRDLLESRRDDPIRSVTTWSRALAAILMTVPAEDVATLIDPNATAGTALAQLGAPATAARQQAGRALSKTLDMWLRGEPLAAVGAALHDQNNPIAVTRGKPHPLPRTLRFVRDGIEHALTTVAGAMLATVQTGAENDPEGPWALDAAALRDLSRLPIALRYGAGDISALALMQAGLRPRVVAHLLARLAPPAAEMPEDDLPEWAWRTLRDLDSPEFVEGVTGNPGERAALRAAAHIRAAT